MRSLLVAQWLAGDTVSASIDQSLRTRIKANHSATHLMHEALRQVLGEHVQQKGSLVDADKLRFDFSHGEAVSGEQLSQVAKIVNDQVRGNSEVLTQEMGMEAAIEAGATALFGEKYGDEVRVLTMGTDRFSVELCGGTHVERTGDIGVFRVVSEGGVAPVSVDRGCYAWAHSKILQEQTEPLRISAMQSKARPQTRQTKWSVSERASRT